MAYLPVECPTGDYYGGHRPGDNLFSGSIVAVDLDTGERKWHYQTVHHDIWDWDLPAGPVLLDITVDGRPIKALIQPTKQGQADTVGNSTDTQFHSWRRILAVGLGSCEALHASRPAGPVPGGAAWPFVTSVS